MSIQRNTATKNGGAIYCTESLGVDWANISENTAGENGGGIYARNAIASSYSTVYGNTAGGAGGGLFSTGSGATVSIYADTFSMNAATGSGGGLYVESGGGLTMQEGQGYVVSNNRAADGGGLFSPAAAAWLSKAASSPGTPSPARAAGSMSSPPRG